MGFDDLTEDELRLYEYIKAGDFQSRGWSSPEAAKKLGIPEEKIYEGLSNLAKHIKNNIWIYYENGEMHVVAE
jgi:hypothetical protein